jgi:hypothetical protein
MMIAAPNAAPNENPINQLNMVRIVFILKAVSDEPLAVFHKDRKAKAG